MTDAVQFGGAVALAAAVRARKISAVEVLNASLTRIAAHNERLAAFTEITEKAARQQAESIDRMVARGELPGPLAGVPFAVKNLFDIEGLVTIAGSRIRKAAPPATRNATAISKLLKAGGVLVGALNMNEFACGITGENSHYGTTRNPHAPSRLAGGSSGGSAAAVAAGFVPFALGSDTNGSIRVPAAFCGVFGFKPTYGRLSRAGVVPFADSLDHIGPIARFVEDLSVTFDLLQGYDSADPVCCAVPPQLTFPMLHENPSGLRVAIAGDYFSSQADPESLRAVSEIARVLGATKTMEIPEPVRACSAAGIITRSEGGNYHLADLKVRASEYDPLTCSRLLAGALIPAAWVSFAQRFRTWYRQRMRVIFEEVDILLAPTTPCPAIEIGQETIVLNGKEVPSRSKLAMFTQPFSFIGLPVISVPFYQPGSLPVGVQLIAAPYQESKLLRLAYQLEKKGIAAAPIASGFA